MENELEKILESKFFSSAGFAQEIEALVKNNENMNYNKFQGQFLVFVGKECFPPVNLK